MTSWKEEQVDESGTFSSSLTWIATRERMHPQSDSSSEDDQTEWLETQKRFCKRKVKKAEAARSQHAASPPQ